MDYIKHGFNGYFPSYSFLRLGGLGNIKPELTKQGNGALIQIWPTSQISLKEALCAVKTTDIQDENLKLKSLCVWYLVVLKKLFSGLMKLKKKLFCQDRYLQDEVH